MNVINFILFLTFSFDIFLTLIRRFGGYYLTKEFFFYSLDSKSGKEPKQMLSSETFTKTA